MANFYESKPMQWVKKAGEKVVGNKGIQAISSGMMMVMGVILLGAVFQLLAVILQTIGIIDQSSGIYSALMVPYKVSMGFISLYVAFTIAYSYAKSLKIKNAGADGRTEFDSDLFDCSRADQNSRSGRGSGRNFYRNGYHGA